MAELEQNLQKELEEISEEQRKVALKATIRVANELFAGVELRIGEQTMVINQDQDKVEFKLVQEEEELKIQERAPPINRPKRRPPTCPVDWTDVHSGSIY